MWRIRDWWALGILAALAALLRFWNFSSLGLTHFDEGSYTMAGRWVASLGAAGFAPQAGHAPPFYPLLVGVLYWVFGPSDTAAIAISAIAGALTVGLVYFLALRLWGPGAAIVSAALLATSEYHIVYSRMALTDALFTLLFWLSLGSLFLACRDNTTIGWVAGGIAAGLCWNTKYHGFLPVLMVLAWWLLSDWTRRRTPESFWRYSDERRISVLGLQAASGLALVLFLPWVLIVSYRPGWGEILAGQWRQSLGGSGWPVTSPTTLLFFLASWSAPMLLPALWGAVYGAWKRRGSVLFLTGVCATFGLTLLFYTPFPRLLLPLIPGLCLLAGFGLTRGLGDKKPVIVLVAAIVLAANLTRLPPLLVLRTDAYRQAASYLDDLEVAVFSQLNKNFYFYERRDSTELRWHTPAQLDTLWEGTVGAVVAIDPILHKLPAQRAWFEKTRDSLELLRRFEVHAYEPVYYQGFDPRNDLDSLPRRVAPFVPGESHIEVYRKR